MEHKYRLSITQKKEVAQNLIDLLENDAIMNAETHRFIAEWILTDKGGKGKAFYDVWDIVLKNFLPTTRPILFRACNRISKNGKIASFTGRIECARRMSQSKGSLIICDTNETLTSDETFAPGEYTHTFYPLVDVLEKAKAAGGWGFTERLLTYSCEDEYIMRINLGHMHSVKWSKFY